MKTLASPRLAVVVLIFSFMSAGCGARDPSTLASSSGGFELNERFEMAGHVAVVSDVAHTADGASVLSCDSGGRLNHWRADTGERLWAIAEPGVAFNRIAVNPAGGFAVVGGRQFLGIVDLASGTWLRRFPEFANLMVTALAVSGDGRKIAVGANDAFIRLVDVATGETTELSGHEWPIMDLQYSADSQSLLAGDSTSIRLWDVDSGVERRRLVDTQAGDVDGVFWMSRLAFSPEGRYILTSSGYEAVMFDLATKQIHQRFQGHEEEVVSARLTQDLTHVITASRDHTVRLWDADTGVEVSRSTSDDLSLTSAVSISPSGNRFVMGAAFFDLFGGFVRSKLAAWDITQQ